ncbi:Adenine phosphoribosyltransferase [Vibrio aerogenes CECT 7868]|uniref:Adenine phosphoribosyltransferase n=2 Tax=Vibrio aerogenes TaxID=92172 RepID=A0A1M5Z9Q4_9VIBR|nr:Adenine phosphoribosyltransferase [Vibrio aerogenes CECT 7868]
MNDALSVSWQRPDSNQNIKLLTMTTETISLIKSSIKSIPDYPKPGILFRDVTSLLENAKAYHATIQLMFEHYKNMGFTKVVGTEARGFLFGAPLAIELGIGFVPVRKPGKLPRPTIAESYELEYGVDTLEIHSDAIVAGDKVLVVDDLLATGGTIEATTKLIRQLGGIVEHATFVINLPDIGGAKRLEEQGLKIYSICDFDGH